MIRDIHHNNIRVLDPKDPLIKRGQYIFNKAPLPITTNGWMQYDYKDILEIFIDPNLGATDTHLTYQRYLFEVLEIVKKLEITNPEFLKNSNLIVSINPDIENAIDPNSFILLSFISEEYHIEMEILCKNNLKNGISSK